MADVFESLDTNPYGTLKVPGLNISLELLILILYPTFLIPAIYFWITYLHKSRRAAVAPAGCKRLGLRGLSNLDDQYDAKYQAGTDDTKEWKIKALMIHPIKSCTSIEVDELELEGAGPKFDRKFVFAELLPPTNAKPDATDDDKKPRWTFRTLRQPGYEKLALVKPEVWVPEPSASKNKSMTRRVERNGALVVKYPNVPDGPLAFLDRFMMRWGLVPSENSFQVPLMPSDDHEYPKEEMKIWVDCPVWLNYGKHIPDDFRHFIGAKHPITLFRADPTALREVYRCAPKKEQIGWQPVVGTADSYPLNLLNIASVLDVGDKVKNAISELSVRRFRCNLVITGPKAYDEDDWKRIKIIAASKPDDEPPTTEIEVYCASHCVRCRLPNVDPDTAVRHPEEPDKTLKSFRCIDAADDQNACLGLQLVPAKHETCTVRVGDRIEVLERGEHFYIKQGG